MTRVTQVTLITWRCIKEFLYTPFSWIHIREQNFALNRRGYSCILSDQVSHLSQAAGALWHGTARDRNCFSVAIPFTAHKPTRKFGYWRIQTLVTGRIYGEKRVSVVPRFTLKTPFTVLKYFILQFLSSKLEYERIKPNWVLTKCRIPVFSVLLICALWMLP